MAICTECGKEVDDEARFCANCGTEMVKEEESQTKFCTNCGFEMEKATKFCPECGTPTDAAPAAARNNRIVLTDKNPVLAAILSFFIVGLGQVYLGLNKKGIILFLAAVVSGFLMLVVIGWITWVIVWGYSIFDAYSSAEKMNAGIAVEDTIDFDNLF